MPENNTNKCWEYWNCKLETRRNCPAYKSKDPCWHVAGGYCGRVSDKQGIGKCFLCEWYKLNHPV